MSIEVRGLKSGYGAVRILHGVSMLAERSKITCIIGHNGAGKSTLLKTIFGIVKKDEGNINFDGEDLSRLRPDQVLRKGISYVPQGTTTFPFMTVLENLEMGAYIERNHDKIKKNIEEVFDIFPILRERKGEAAGAMSGGEQRMLEFGRALMLRPKALLLDEPSMGLSPKLVSEVVEKIGELNKTGMTILMVEQNVRMGLSIADYGYVLVLGKNAHEGPAKDLLDSYGDLLKTYLSG
ncbi:MAG: ABC transporter ATP-binding protein [Candidatus Bathyarchaeia archaeon]|jgi:branched-chain amino acid transport system ATP-binding protein